MSHWHRISWTVTTRFGMRKVSEYLAKTDTDKLSRHGYGGFYDRLFELLTRGGSMTVRVLEIGISRFGQGSAHAFHAMPFVAFVGMDILSVPDFVPAASPTLDMSCFIRCDAYSSKGVQLAGEHAPYHLIIDDGSHAPVDQIFFFEEYHQLLHPEGVMVCEDVHQRHLDGDAYKALSHLDLSLVRPDYFGGADDSNLLVLWND